MATQLITLLGVLLGAASSYLGGTAKERVRYRRDLDQRWSERKLEAYVAYLSNIKQNESNCAPNTARHWPGPKSSHTPHKGRRSATARRGRDSSKYLCRTCPACRQRRGHYWGWPKRYFLIGEITARYVRQLPYEEVVDGRRSCGGLPQSQVRTRW
jgi:hypothetical protein